MIHADILDHGDLAPVERDRPDLPAKPTRLRVGG
jgi:hypothetical protein